jgi:hypothetical protein
LIFFDVAMEILYTSKEELEAIFAKAISKYLPQQGNESLGCNRKKWLTHTQAAVYLSMTNAALYQRTSKREVNYHKRGKQNLYTVEDLDKFVEKGRVQTMSEIRSEFKLQPTKKHSITKPNKNENRRF